VIEELMRIAVPLQILFPQDGRAPSAT